MTSSTVGRFRRPVTTVIVGGMAGSRAADEAGHTAAPPIAAADAAAVHPADPAGPTIRRWPGVLAAVVAAALAQQLADLVPHVSTLLVAVLVGVVIGNTPARFDVLRPGLAAVARIAIRLGVVLLGFRLAIGDIVALGWPTMLLVGLTVGTTFLGTQAAGRRLGLSPDLSLLVATGFSICGASAIAAMAPNSDADGEDVAASIGLVTVAGTVLTLGLPLVATGLGLGDAAFGTWVGASGPDVAQVVAAASTGGTTVLSVAVVVKLSRIVLLAPIVTAVGIARSRRIGSTGVPAPALVPAFVVGFLLTMSLRSSGMLPTAWFDLAGAVEQGSFALALVGLGAGVRVARLRRLGAGPMVLGLIAWLIVGAVSLIGVVIIAP